MKQKKTEKQIKRDTMRRKQTNHKKRSGKIISPN